MMMSDKFLTKHGRSRCTIFAVPHPAETVSVRPGVPQQLLQSEPVFCGHLTNYGILLKKCSHRLSIKAYETGFRRFVYVAIGKTNCQEGLRAMLSTIHSLASACC